MTKENEISVVDNRVKPQWQVGTYEWSPASDRLMWSPELLHIYGLDDPPASEQEFAQLVHPDDRVRVEAETNSFLSSEATRYSHVFRILRADGEVRVILDRGAIERDQAGKVSVIHGMNLDVTNDLQFSAQFSEAQLDKAQLELARHTARGAEARYRALFEAIDEGFCVVEVRFDRPDGRIDYRVVEANSAFYERTGFPKSILCQWLREAAPDLEEHWYETYGRVAKSGEPIRFEQRSEMLSRWFDVYAFRIDSPQDGRVAILFSDISDRKRQEEHVQLLMQEVNHRSKNLLSLVQAIARQTSTSHAELFLERFGQRLQALASAQDLLVQNSWKSVPLLDLVNSQLAHFTDLIGDRIEVAGAPVSLTPPAVQALGMALHELATNAAKYGALSTERGKVSVTWAVEEDASSSRLTMNWVEQNGPPVGEPERRGFGSAVTKEMVEATTRGEVSIKYGAAGLMWKLSCPSENVIQRQVG